MTTEDLSAGLQVVDVVLWLFKRTLDAKDIGPMSGALMNRVFKRGLQTDFSFEGVRAHMTEKFGKVLSLPLSAENQAAAEEKMAEFEAHRRKQMQEYAAKKAVSQKVVQ
jgi:hypothetical protein